MPSSLRHLRPRKLNAPPADGLAIGNSIARVRRYIAGLPFGHGRCQQSIAVDLRTRSVKPVRRHRLRQRVWYSSVPVVLGLPRRRIGGFLSFYRRRRKERIGALGRDVSGRVCRCRGGRLGRSGHGGDGLVSLAVTHCVAVPVQGRFRGRCATTSAQEVEERNRIRDEVSPQRNMLVLVVVLVLTRVREVMSCSGLTEKESSRVGSSLGARTARGSVGHSASWTRSGLRFGGSAGEDPGDLEPRAANSG